MNDCSIRTRGMILAAALAVGAASSPALAANKTWDGGDADDSLWTSADNWNAAVVANDTLFFDGTARLTNTNDFAANTQFKGITFNATAGAFTLSGNAITLAGNIANASAVTQTINLDLTGVNANRSLTAAGGGLLRINGGISGTAGIAVTNNTGGVTLAGDLALDGTTAIDLVNGTLTLSGDNSAITTKINLRSTATLLNIGSAKALGNGTVRVGTTSDGMTIDNTSGAALTLTTSPTIELHGPLTFNGTHDLNLGSSAVTRSSTAGGVFNVVQNTLTIGGVVEDNPSLAGMVVNKQGAGTLVLNGDNTYTGQTTVTTGTLLINGDQSAATGNVVVNGGILGGTGILGGATTVNSGGTLSPGQSVGTLTINNNLTVKNGAIALFEGGDLVDVNGTLDLDDNWTLKLTSGFSDGGSMVLFTYDTLATSPDLNPTFDISGLSFTPSGSLFLTDTGDSIVLNGLKIIPEPASLALLSLSGLLMLPGRRRQA